MYSVSQGQLFTILITFTKDEQSEQTQTFFHLRSAAAAAAADGASWTDFASAKGVEGAGQDWKLEPSRHKATSVSTFGLIVLQEISLFWPQSVLFSLLDDP